jgi:hypothetical protein
MAVGVCQWVCLHTLCKQLPWTAVAAAAAAAAAAVRTCGQWTVPLIFGGRLHTAAAAVAAVAAGV